MTAPAAKQRTLYMIGNAHIDPVWLWQWQEGFQEIKATFRSALDRMKEYPEFRFTASSAAFYEWVERNDPEMFREIQQRVAEGRWEIVGGWWVEPDCNIPGGEAFVRHGLYSQRYFESRFGRIARVGYNPDSFGHNAMLPQILVKTGLEHYVFMRPQPHEKWLPDRTFWWESPDGSRVLTFRIRGEYCTWPRDLEEHVRGGLNAILPPLDAIMLMYGVGDHGGGPTKQNIESLERLGADPQYPTIRFSTTLDYFESARASGAEFPVVRDELQHHAKGCYAAHSGVKRWNRRAENALLVAERLSAVASCVVAQAAPTRELERAWRLVLFQQFHDVLAGTSIEPAYEDARDAYGEATGIAARALNDAVQALSWRIDIPFEEGTRPLVATNPHGHGVRAVVELESGTLPEGHGLVDETGAAVPMQTVRSLATAPGRQRIAFLADLPPLGHRLYRVRAGAARDAETCDASDTHLASSRIRLEIDRATGGIASLVHDGAAVLHGVGARPVVVDDRSDTWGHGIRRFQDVAGTFAGTSARLVEHGPVRSTIRTEATYGSSLLVQEFSVSRALDRVEVRVTVDWRERHKMLKLRFPVAVREPVATFEIPYGHLTRTPGGDEEPGQTWVDVSGRGERGLAIVNDSKGSYDVLGDEIGLTVLRSPIYAHHDPLVPREGERYVYQDQGIQTFRYVLIPHAGSWQDAGVARVALELVQPPVALFEASHPGPLDAHASHGSVAPENVLLSVLKLAEDGSGDLVVRCVETAGRATDATIALTAWGRTIRARFGPQELKTFRVPPGGEPYETDLLERRIA